MPESFLSEAIYNELFIKVILSSKTDIVYSLFSLWFFSNPAKRAEQQRASGHITRRRQTQRKRIQFTRSRVTLQRRPSTKQRSRPQRPTRRTETAERWVDPRTRENGSNQFTYFLIVKIFQTLVCLFVFDIFSREKKFFTNTRNLYIWFYNWPLVNLSKTSIFNTV